MTRGDAFEVTLLALVEAMANTIRQRHPAGSQRAVQAEILRKQTEVINKTYKGQFPESFVMSADAFFGAVEGELNKLLRSYESTE